MARMETAPRTGGICPGASIMPTSAVKTTSDMTRGFRSAKKSPATASERRTGQHFIFHCNVIWSVFPCNVKLDGPLLCGPLELT